VTDDRSWRLAVMTWREAGERLEACDVALLPVGAVEQHGPHLTLDTDLFHADRVCRDVALACGEPYPVVLPAIPFGVSYHHDDFPGTISVSAETLGRYVFEVGRSIAHQGIRKLVIVNGHGGNAPALQTAAQRIHRKTGMFVCVDTGETSDADVAEIAETPGDIHAGEIETSEALYLRPDDVRELRPGLSVPRFAVEALDEGGPRSVPWFSRTSRFSAEGVLGDPSRATVEKGRRMWKIQVARLAELVTGLRGRSLEELRLDEGGGGRRADAGRQPSDRSQARAPHGGRTESRRDEDA